MKKYTVINDLKCDEDIDWVITQTSSDLHNCEAQPIGCDGSWLLCVDPDCEDNVLDSIKIISEPK